MYEEKQEESSTPLEEQVTEPSLVEQLEAEVAQLKDQWLRAIAELDNLRKRQERERDEARKFAHTHFAREMLNVSDNLRRALESCAPQETFPETLQSLITGLEMTEKELWAIFERQGIRAINPLGEKFDPHFHQAMLEIENQEQTPGTIVQVLQIGYTLHDRLLRPALVAVVKHSP